MPSDTPMPSSFDNDRDFYEENRLQKLTRRLKEEPLIPFGCILTCMALVGATRSMRAGDHNRTNRMFRARIYAQGFTLAALVAGSFYWQEDRFKRKQFEDAVAEQKASEKRDAWIRELEARDEEDKQIEAKRQAWRKEQLRQREEFSKQEPTGVLDENARLEAWRKGQLSGRGGSSMIDDKERRTGVLEAVTALVYGNK